MSTKPLIQAYSLLNGRTLSRFVEKILHRYRVRITISELTEEQIFDTCARLVTNVITTVWRAKLATKHVIELLDIEPVAERLRKWQGSTNSTILHEACKECRYDIIEQVIKRLGKDFIHKRDTFGNYPVNLLLDNITGDPLTSSAGQLITLLAIDGNDMGPLIYLKNTVLKMLCHSRVKKTRFVKEALDVFAQHNLYTDEDRKNLIAAIQPTRNCVSRLCERKIHAITVMKMTPADLEEIYRTVYSQKGVVKYLLNQRPDFLLYLLRNKTANGEHVAGFNDQLFLDGVLAKLPSEVYMPLFLFALNQFAPADFEPLVARLQTVNGSTFRIIASLLKFSADVPKSYLPLIAPYKGSWIHTKLISTEVTAHFPWGDLPAEMTVHVISFLSLQATVAFSLVNKQYYEIINTKTTWQRMQERYFPNILRFSICVSSYLRPPLDEVVGNRENFLSHYNEKMSGYYSGEMHITAPHPGGFVSLELKDNALIYCSTHQLGVYDTQKKTSVTKPIAKPSSARLLGDVVFVYTSDSIALLAKKDLATLQYFETPVPATVKDVFAVSNDWLVTPRCVYDWRRGHLMSTWDERLEQVALRDNVFYGLSATGLVMKDVRDSNVAAKINVDLASMGPVSLNAHNNFVYLAGNRIETYDMRYPCRMNTSPFATEINDSKVIDLVSMNVWTSGIVWDLIDFKWGAWDGKTAAPLGPLAVCDGGNIIYPIGNSLSAIHLSLAKCTWHSPYGDFKCQYLTSPYTGYDYANL